MAVLFTDLQGRLVACNRHAEELFGWSQDELIGRRTEELVAEPFDKATAAYDKALERAPGLSGAWVGRGNVLIALKRCDEAISAHDKALALMPGACHNQPPKFRGHPAPSPRLAGLTWLLRPTR